MIWSVNQIELFGFFTDLGTLTSASINLVFNKELLIVQCEVRNKISVKQEKVCSEADPGFFVGGGALLRNGVIDWWRKQILIANTKKKAFD